MEDLPPSSSIRESSPHGRYVKLDSRLGSGAYKDVWRAYDTNEGIEVAWNVVKLNRVPPNERKRIKTEVSLLRDIEHKNVIKYYNSWVDREKEQIIFITEIMSSGSLKDYLRKNPIIRWNAVKRWCRQILHGLEFLHANKIIHRDIKCDNIFINGTAGDLRIGDLGLSTRIAEERAASSNGESNDRQITTATMTCLGTPEFMAPELYEESYTDKVDVYAFGMAMIEMVTGLLPYHECTSAAQIYKKVLNGEFPPELHMIERSHPRACEFIRMCLLSQDQRPSATELLANNFLLPNEEEDYKEVRVKLTSFASLPAIAEANDHSESDGDLNDTEEASTPIQRHDNAQFKMTYDQTTRQQSDPEKIDYVPLEVQNNLPPNAAKSISSPSRSKSPGHDVTKKDNVKTFPCETPQTAAIDILNEPIQEKPSIKVQEVDNYDESATAVEDRDSSPQSINRGNSVGSVNESDNIVGSGVRSSRTLIRRKYSSGGTSGGRGSVSESSQGDVSRNSIDGVSDEPSKAQATNLTVQKPTVKTSVVVTDVVCHSENSNVLIFHVRLSADENAEINSNIGNIPQVEIEFDYDMLLDDCEVIAEEMIFHPDISHLSLEKQQVLKIFQPFVDSAKQILGSSDLTSSSSPRNSLVPVSFHLAKMILDDVIIKNVCDAVLLKKLKERKNSSIDINSQPLVTPTRPSPSEQNTTFSDSRDNQNNLSNNQRPPSPDNLGKHSYQIPLPQGPVYQLPIINGIPVYPPSWANTSISLGAHLESNPTQRGYPVINGQSSNNLYRPDTLEKPVSSDNLNAFDTLDLTDEELENDEEYKEALSKYNANVARIEKEHAQRNGVIQSQKKALEETYKKKRDELLSRREDLCNQLLAMQTKFKERMSELEDRKKQLEDLLIDTRKNDVLTDDSSPITPRDQVVYSDGISDGQRERISSWSVPNAQNTSTEA